MPPQRVQVIPLRDLMRGGQRSKWRIRQDAIGQDTAESCYHQSPSDEYARWQQEEREQARERARQEALYWAWLYPDTSGFAYRRQTVQPAPQYDPSAGEYEARWQQEVHAYLLERARQEALYWAGTQPTAAPERIPLWVWCAGVAVVQFLVGCILLLTAINSSVLSYVLALAGFCTTLSLCFPEGRAQPLVCLLSPYPAVFVIGLVVGFFTSFP
jgi:hypothetical protein